MKNVKYQLSQRRCLQIILAGGLILFFLSFCNSLWAQSTGIPDSSSSGPGASDDITNQADKIDGLGQDLSDYNDQMQSEMDNLNYLKDEMKNAPDNAAKNKIQEKIQKVLNNIDQLNQKIDKHHSKIDKAQKKIDKTPAEKEQALQQAMEQALQQATDQTQMKGETLRPKGDSSAQRSPAFAGSKRFGAEPKSDIRAKPGRIKPSPRTRPNRSKKR